MTPTQQQPQTEQQNNHTRKLPDRARKASKWPQKAKYQKVREQKILQKLFRPHLSPKNNPIEHKKAENETKKTKQKNQKSENKKN